MYIGSFFNSGIDHTVFELNGIKFGMLFTKDGDGDFYSNDGKKFAVDSGTIGCVLLEHIHESPEEIKEMALGHIIEFDNEFGVKNHEGILQFGKLYIDTTNDECWDIEQDKDFML